MFTHLFKYRFKLLIRNKSMIFWTLIFPIALATFFNVSIGSLANQHDFNAINIALVEQEPNEDFVSLVKELSTGKDKMFITEITTMQEAKNLLAQSKISGIIISKFSPSLIVNDLGIEQSIIKIFMDHYNQTSATVNKIISNNPDNIADLAKAISTRMNYTKQVPISENPINQVLTYFYALLAMTCFYGSFFGLEEVSRIQANLSCSAARLSLAPTHKLKAFLSSLLASVLVQLLEMFIFLAYLIYGLNIDFGSNIPIIIFTIIIGSITGIAFGSFVGIYAKGDLNMKSGVLIGTTMAGSFLAGLMFGEMKYIIQSKAPLLSWLNPVNLLADSFYSLYYFGVSSRYWYNIIGLSIFTLIFCTLTYCVIRRKQYASI